MIEIENLTFSHTNKPLLKGLSLSIARGQIVSLLGSSGSGKTTLFRLMTGLQEGYTGSVRLLEKSAYMMQEDLLLPWRTVLENVLLAQELKQKSLSKQRALDLLAKVGLQSVIEAYPHQLSAGMRQRASLARALFSNCPLLLLDEPFSSLDLITKEEMYTLLTKLRDELNITILLITHDFHDALFFSERALLLKEGQIAGDWTIPKSNDLETIERLKGEMRLKLS